jgi:CRISPR-associated protein Cas2
MQTLVVFDIGNTPLRNRIEDACKDAGMVRVQWSLFLGELDPARRGRLIEKLKQHIDAFRENETSEQQRQALVIHLFTLCAADFDNALEINRCGAQPATPIVPPRVVIL